MSHAHGPMDGDREVLQKFEVQKFLGKGSYGSVFRVKRISDGKVYALKETNVRHMSAAERHEAVNEIRLLASVKNQHIVGYHEAFVDGNRLCIVMEYAQAGDLSKMIRKRQKDNKPMDEDLIWSYFIQLSRGLAALHGARVLHRDMKAANVLRVSPTQIKIGDLGVAKVMKHAMTNTQIGTPHYMPPEVWKNRPYGFTSDTWALGCLLYEMCNLCVPFEARSMSELRYKVLRGKYNPIPQFYSHDMSQMIRLLLDAEPNNRPSMSQLLEHPSVRKRTHLVTDHVPSPPQSEASTAMLDTIKVPKNLRLLKGRLPAPSYPEPLREEDEQSASWPPPPPPPEGSDQRLPNIDKGTHRSSPPVIGGGVIDVKGEDEASRRGGEGPPGPSGRNAGVRASEPALALPQIGGRVAASRQSYAMGSRAESNVSSGMGGRPGGRYSRAPPAIQQELYDRLQRQLPGSRDPRATPSYAGSSYNYPRYQKYQQAQHKLGHPPPSGYAQGHHRLGKLLEHEEKRAPVPPSHPKGGGGGGGGGGGAPRAVSVRAAGAARPPGARGEVVRAADPAARAVRRGPWESAPQAGGHGAPPGSGREGPRFLHGLCASQHLPPLLLARLFRRRGAESSTAEGEGGTAYVGVRVTQVRATKCASHKVCEPHLVRAGGRGGGEG